MKLLQEVRGLAQVTNRRPEPRTPGLFLLQMRSHMLHTTGGREKRTIQVDMQVRPELPLPVKIKHLKPALSVLASSAAR